MTPSRFCTGLLCAYFATNMSLVRPFWVIAMDEADPWSQGRFLSKVGILGVGAFCALHFSIA